MLLQGEEPVRTMIGDIATQKETEDHVGQIQGQEKAEI